MDKHLKCLQEVMFKTYKRCYFEKPQKTFQKIKFRKEKQALKVIRESPRALC
jgi:hypothetical protein